MPAEGFPIDLHRGERIGKYEVVTQLSVGGMAEIFLGFTSGPGGFRKYVVIKRILPDARDNAQFERMFLDEARITAAFNHPNIAQVFDLGQEDDGLYLAMEFIAGQNLNQVTGAHLRRRRQVPLGFTLSVARDVCMALHYAHTYTTPSGEPSPVIHRDVAQKNVMVTYDGVVKLLDFGIAKAKGSLERTKAGTVKGTTGYMSPEQVRGEKLDGRSDLFSVGVMMHELITGARLFSGKTERDEMVKILEAPIPWPSHVSPHVPEEVSKVIMQALERSRERRFLNGRDMARAIEAAAGGKLLMDSDHRASLMQELFAERMQATRALLESADGTTGSVVVASAKRALRADDGPYLPERQEKDTSKDEETLSGKPPRKVPAAPDTQPEARGRSSGALWAVLLALLVAGGGFGVLRLTQALNATVEPGQQEVVEAEYADPTLKRLPTFREPGTEPADAGVKAETPVAAPDAGTALAKGDKGTGRAQKKGMLILSLNPTADVDLYLGKKKVRSLGREPIIKTSIPVGDYRLRIVGPDRKDRWLAVPIKEGETTRMALKLADIPTG